MTDYNTRENTETSPRGFPWMMGQPLTAHPTYHLLSTTWGPVGEPTHRLNNNILDRSPLGSGLRSERQAIKPGC